MKAMRLVNGTPELRLSLKVLLPALALLGAGGWLAAWKLAAGATETALDEWFAQENAAGRIWTCGERKLGGFPFRIELHCARPTFSGLSNKLKVEGSVGDILAGAHVFQPGLITATITSPFKASIGPGAASITVQWNRMTAAWSASDGALLLGSLHIEGAAIEGQGFGFAQATAVAQSVDVHIRSNSVLATSCDLVAEAHNLATPVLDQALGGQDPTNMSLAVTGTRIDSVLRMSGGRALARWRRAGGQAEIKALHVERGELDLEANGALDIDDAHRLRGHIDVAASGLTDVMARFGIPAAALAIGNLLGGLTGKPDQGEALGKPGATHVVLTLADGRALLGPLRLPFALKPLY